MLYALVALDEIIFAFFLIYSWFWAREYFIITIWVFSFLYTLHALNVNPMLVGFWLSCFSFSTLALAWQEIRK